MQVEQSQSAKRICPILVEIGKWALVLWLLWPMHAALRTSVNFTRVVIGIALFVIFNRDDHEISSTG